MAKRTCYSAAFGLAAIPLLLCSVAEVLGAASPSIERSLTLATAGYEVRRWGVEDGLPDDRTQGFAQTADRLLWVGTPRGLAVFDGILFDLPTHLQEYTGAEILGGDSRRRLWLRGLQGQVGYALTGVVHTIKTPELADPCEGYAEGPDGIVWFYGGGRIFRYQGDRLERLDSLAPADHISSIAAGSDQTLWVTRKDELFLVTAEGFRKHPLVAPETGSAPVIGPLCRRADGSLAVITKIGLFVAEPGGWKLQHRFAEWLQHRLSRIKKFYGDEAGNVWLIDEQELFVSFADGASGRIELPADGPPVGCVDLLGDAEGNVWLATLNGLYRVRPTPFSRWTEKEGLLGNRILGIDEDGDGRIWVVSSGGVQYFPPGSAALQTVELGAPTAVEFVTPGPGGAVWFSTREGRVWRWAAGQVRSVGAIDETASLRLEFFKFLPSGRLFASSAGQEVYQWTGNRFARLAVPSVSNEIGAVSCLAEDSQGRLYAAFSRELFRLEEGNWRQLIDEQQSNGSALARIFIDPEDAVWISLWPQGLARWSEQSGFQVLGADWRIPEVVYATFDGGNGLWLNTAVNGVGRLDLTAARESLARGNGEVQIDWFDHHDGLGTLAGSGYFGGALTARDGRVWMATAKGLCVVDPARWEELRRRSPPAPVRIELVSRDREGPQYRGPENGLVIADGNRGVEFRYAAVNLTRPDRTRFKYRLRGYEADWVESGSDHTARYPRLGPGRYEFEVLAANAFNQWNRQGTSLALRVRPVWWRSAWFQAIALAFTAGLVALSWVGWRRRNGLQPRNQDGALSRQLILSQDQEQKRLATELEKTLGQNLLVAKNIALIGLNTNATNVETAHQFREISETITNALGQTRAISGSLHPQELDHLAGLSRALRALVERTTQSAGIEGHAQIDEIDDAFAPGDRLFFYKLAEQSLNELLQNSAPAKVVMSVRREGACLGLVVEGQLGAFEAGQPDGRCPTTGPSTLEERVRLLGGQFKRVVTPRHGVSFQFTIPIQAGRAASE